MKKILVFTDGRTDHVIKDAFKEVGIIDAKILTSNAISDIKEIKEELKKGYNCFLLDMRALLRFVNASNVFVGQSYSPEIQLAIETIMEGIKNVVIIGVFYAPGYDESSHIYALKNFEVNGSKVFNFVMCDPRHLRYHANDMKI